MKEAIDSIENAFTNVDSEDCRMLPRQIFNVPKQNGDILFMSAQLMKNNPVITKIVGSFPNNPSKYNKLLQNKSLGMIFQKQSTRTRLSFNIGMKKIGGNVIELDKNAIGLGQRESDLDIISTLSQYIDCLMIRNDNHSKIIALSKLNLLPIINGLSDFSHPCQILSDIFTIEEILGPIDNKIISWVGDINNVLISLIHASQILQFTLKIASPKKIVNKIYNKE